jgi:hypothetical protein
VRRTRLVGAQAELFPNWRYHAFVTDRVGTTVWLDQDHRRHAVVELCIRDLKAGVGLRHCPSGKFNANAAWLAAATLAHNLLRWVAQLGLGTHEELVVAKTLRRTLLALPPHPLRQAMDAPPARGLALGTMVRAGPGPAALHPLRHLTGPAKRNTPDPSGSARACSNLASKPPYPHHHPTPALTPSRSRLRLTSRPLQSAHSTLSPTPKSRIGGSRLTLQP